MQRILTGDGAQEFPDLFREMELRDITSHNLPSIRRWTDPIELQQLFTAMSIPPSTIDGQLFDQRYIDFLNAQPNRVAQIHWRQFEFLTGEFFRRNGYTVRVTPPSGDGGVDVIAERLDSITGPDCIVIQCRRYAGTTVTIDEVKAFWATILDSNATKGLIVTTSRLEDGARHYCEARKYRLTPGERETVEKWLQSLGSYKTESFHIPGA